MLLYDYNKLKGLIREHYGTQLAFAKALGISISTLVNKLSQKSSFTQPEMQKSLALFGLPLSEVDVVFFTPKKQKNVS